MSLKLVQSIVDTPPQLLQLQHPPQQRPRLKNRNQRINRNHHILAAKRKQHRQLQQQYEQQHHRLQLRQYVIAHNKKKKKTLFFLFLALKNINNYINIGFEN